MEANFAAMRRGGLGRGLELHHATNSVHRIGIDNADLLSPTSAQVPGGIYEPTATTDAGDRISAVEGVGLCSFFESIKLRRPLIVDVLAHVADEIAVAIRTCARQGACTDR